MKILLRATVSPFSCYSVPEMLKNNYLGNNSGNLLFAYSLMKLLMTEGTTVDTTNQYDYTEEEIERVNTEYDYYVIALTNAFRPNYVTKLKKLTKLIRRLTIPCVVVGVGLQSDYEPDFSDGFSFDGEVKEFVTAVLEKSASIGVRGEITQKYLNNLGFSNIDVIGCPSMYMNGEKMLLKERVSLTSETPVSMNVSSGMPYPYLQFVERSIRELPNYCFVPQEHKELRLMYAGVPFPQKFKGQDLFPNELSREVYEKDRANYFLNVPTWLSYMENISFSFGTRIHGNIAAVLSGVPTFIFAADARVRELAQYHQIPFMPIREVNEKTELMDIYEKTDFSQVQKGHKERYQHFCDFLTDNQLPYLTQEQIEGENPFDTAMQKIIQQPPIRSITAVSKAEQAMRLTTYWKYMQEEIDAYKEEIKQLKSEKKTKRSASGIRKYLRWS